MEGKKESLIPWIVDVRDIARAHVLAAERPEAGGRYIVSNNHTVGSARLFKALKQAFPEYAIPEAKEEPSKQILQDPLKVCSSCLERKADLPRRPGCRRCTWTRLAQRRGYTQLPCCMRPPCDLTQDLLYKVVKIRTKLCPTCAIPQGQQGLDQKHGSVFGSMHSRPSLHSVLSQATSRTSEMQPCNPDTCQLIVAVLMSAAAAGDQGAGIAASYARRVYH